MENRKALIAGNWKMYKTIPEAVETAGKLVELISTIDDVEVVIAPSFTALASVANAIKGSRIALSAQNLYWESEGAFTGEIAPAMLVSAGCSHVIIGHSERRQYFGETDETVNRKIKAAIEADLVPVFCIGETEIERETNKTFSVLDKQVELGLENLLSDQLDQLVIAYEPVWAIGTGKTATSDQAQEVHQFLRELIAKRYGNKLANATRILYGGSVKPDNVRELMSKPDVDGALVGGASLDPVTFSKLVSYKG